MRLDILGKAPFFQLVGIEFEKTSSSATAAGFFPHTVLLIRCQWAGKAAKQVYHKLRQKDRGSDAECQSLSLWERWHATGVTERASPARKSRRAAIGRLFVGAILSQCRAVWQHPCPLSRACARQLPQRGSPWQAGQLPTGRLRPDMAQKGGRCYRGQRLLDKRTLSSYRWPRQRSTTVPETSSFACPVEA